MEFPQILRRFFSIQVNLWLLLAIEELSSLARNACCRKSWPVRTGRYYASSMCADKGMAYAGQELQGCPEESKWRSYSWTLWNAWQLLKAADIVNQRPLVEFSVNWTMDRNFIQKLVDSFLKRSSQNDVCVTKDGTIHCHSDRRNLRVNYRATYTDDNALRESECLEELSGSISSKDESVQNVNLRTTVEELFMENNRWRITSEQSRRSLSPTLQKCPTMKNKNCLGEVDVSLSYM